MPSGGLNRKTEIGNRYGKLLVIDEAPSTVRGLAVWRCRCDCGKEASVRGFDLRQKRRKSCGCLQGRNKRGDASPRWIGYQTISGSFWNRLKKSAETRNYPLTITMEYVWEIYESQNRRCALSGVEIVFDPSDINARIKGTQTASIDRIDNAKGYVEGNIQLVHKDVNIMRQDMAVDEFVEWCRKVVESNEA